MMVHSCAALSLAHHPPGPFMNESFSSRIGGILSADIAVPELELELSFYRQVLTTGLNPLWRPDLTNNRGTPVIGLGARSPEYQALPIQWMPHIQVADVAASVACALKLGGKSVLHAKGDDGKSQWAVLLDPNNAAFGLIPVIPADSSADPGQKIGHDAADAFGSISWLNLTVPDADASQHFYCQVVGWSSQAIEKQDDEDSSSDYNMNCADGRPAAGICQARGATPDVPPVWLIFLPVGDLPNSLRRVRELGGEVVAETNKSDKPRTYVVVRDPVGACLALVAA